MKQTEKKPVLRAQHWGKRVLPMAGKLLVLVAVLVVLGLVFGMIQAIQNMLIRTVLTVGIAAVTLLVFWNEGATVGFKDVETSRRAEHLGKDSVDEHGYHPLKALCAALVVFGIPLLLAVILAATAKPYTYTMQDLPAWLLGTYGARTDVMAPLVTYAQETGLAVVDVLRMIVRLPVLVYVNLFSDPQKMVLMIDRLSPLMLLSYPAAYLAGYLCAPSVYEKQQTMQNKAKRAAVRKAKKHKMAKTLLEGGGEVHYGQNAEKHEKKKLI